MYSIIFLLQASMSAVHDSSLRVIISSSRALCCKNIFFFVQCITLTSTLIILDITKTSSNNCLVFSNIVVNITLICICQSEEGRAVRKPINSNPGLKVNRNMYFSCIKTFFTAYVLCSLKLFKFKTERKKYKQKTSSQSYKTELKFLANP